MRKVVSIVLVFLLMLTVLPGGIGGWNAPAMAATSYVSLSEREEYTFAGVVQPNVYDRDDDYVVLKLKLDNVFYYRIKGYDTRTKSTKAIYLYFDNGMSNGSWKNYLGKRVSITGEVYWRFDAIDLEVCKVSLLSGTSTKPTKVKLDKTKATITEGQSGTLSATISPINASQKVTWSSSNKKIATVSSSGVVKGIKKGQVTITAKTGNGKIAKCIVTVKPTVKPLPMNKELTKHIGTNINEFVKNISGMKYEGGWEPDYWYGNSYIGVSALWGSKKINGVQIRRKCDYTIFGAKYGMTKAKAISLLKSKGWKTEYNSSREVWMRNKKGYILTMAVKSGCITGIYYGAYAGG